MIRISVKFDKPDLDLLDRQASYRNVTRSELIRRRVLGEIDGGTKKFNPRQYQELVSAAHRCCDMPRNQVERLVAFVFCQVMESAPLEANPSA